MSRRSIIGLAALAALFLVQYFVLAVFSEPTAAPPNNNTPAPLNVGPASQKKDGDIELNNLKAGSITLGGITRTTWPASGGNAAAACTWEGTKCDCKSDSSGLTGVRIIIGQTCTNSQITDNQIIDLELSTSFKKKRCPDTAPVGCAANLYRRD